MTCVCPSSVHPGLLSLGLGVGLGEPTRTQNTSTSQNRSTSRPPVPALLKVGPRVLAPRILLSSVKQEPDARQPLSKHCSSGLLSQGDPWLCLVWLLPSCHCLLPVQAIVRHRPVSPRPGGEKLHPRSFPSKEPLSTLSLRGSHRERKPREDPGSLPGLATPRFQSEQAACFKPRGSPRAFGGP